MRLTGVRLTNFRGYHRPTYISLDRLTAFVGRNDAGKSTIFDAIAAFFEHPLAKVDSSDLCVRSAPNDDISIACLFGDLPSSLTLDSSSVTTLEAEHLVNEDGLLEIEKAWPSTDRRVTTKPRTVAWALHPTAKDVEHLLLKKNTELKRAVEKAGISEDIDLRSNSELRKALCAHTQDLRLERTEVPLDKEDAKNIWDQLAAHLPDFALFRADRASTDEDAEVQDPFRVAIRQAIADLGPELASILDTVRARALDVATRTVAKLRDFDAPLASTLVPEFRSEPKWDTLFRLALSAEDGVALNKRGSGVRRLVLFSFFRAEAERLRTSRGRASIIYAVEEPETAQHPDHQRMVVEALQTLSVESGCQVLLTTHVPGLASLLPVESLRHLVREARGDIAVRSGRDDVYRAIAMDLGVLADRRASVALCVEGKHDLAFLKRINRLLRRQNPTLVDLAADPRLVVILLGGNSLQDWVNHDYLHNAGLREVHIYDRDASALGGEPKYAGAAAKVNARPDGSKAFITFKRELENYLHPDAISEAFDIHTPTPVKVQVDDECDVEGLVKAVLSAKRVGRRSLKAVLNEDAADRMTLERLKERGAYDEVLGWLVEVGRTLQPAPPVEHEAPAAHGERTTGAEGDSLAVRASS